MAIIQMVQNDTAPSYQFPLLQSDGVTPVDLTGSTVRFRIKDPDSNAETNTDANNTMSVIGLPTAGLVQYSWNVGDLPLAKTYLADVRITYGSGKRGTFFEQVQIQTRAEN